MGLIGKGDVIGNEIIWEKWEYYGVGREEKNKDR